MLKLRITEIFYSLQGETSTVGIPTVFIRLTGCPLRCQYCDTSYAFSHGQWQLLSDIITHVRQFNTQYVTVTGGEPLAQKGCIPLLKELCDLGYRVSLETSGAFAIHEVDARVIKILDIKTPGSNEEKRNHWPNLDALTQHDQVKFVICDRTDYDWAKQILVQHQLTLRCHVLFSPSYQQMPAHDLADWIIQDQLPVRMQIQLHKYLWGDAPGR